MQLPSAVLRIDHQNAEIVEFDATRSSTHHIRTHSHQTRQHHSDVRTQHEFFGRVCDVLAPEAEILVTGPHTGLADFRHYVNKHRPALSKQIVGWEAVDHPSDGQLLAFARQYLSTHRRMAAPPA